MNEGWAYAVRVRRRGTAFEPFGWEILRQADGHEVARSPRTFPTRTEALLDCARTAVAMAVDIDEVLLAPRAAADD